MLLSNEKMEKLNLQDVNIRDTNGNPVPIDYILGKVPYLTEFTYDNLFEIHSNHTLKNLNSIQLKNKIKFLALKIYKTSDELDAEIFGGFVTKNLATDGKAEFYFSQNAPEVSKIRTVLQGIKDNWVLPGITPAFVVHDWL